MVSVPEKRTTNFMVGFALMNKRIQELAEQAGIHIQYTPGMEELIGKFAESIVEECAKVAVEAESTGVARLIMIHFGVEE